MPLPNANETTRKLNPGVFDQRLAGELKKNGLDVAAPDKPRLKQNRAEMNKTERAYLEWMRRHQPHRDLLREAITLLVANGVRYTADFAEFMPTTESLVLHEVKGPYMREDAALKLKTAARVFPHIAFFLCTPADKMKVTWKIERVWP